MESTGKPFKITIKGAVFFVVRTGNGCLEYSSHMDRDGKELKCARGLLPGNDKSITVVNFVCQATKGPLLKGMRPLRICQNGKCINPAHLVPATKSQTSIFFNADSDEQREIFLRTEFGLNKKGEKISTSLPPGYIPLIATGYERPIPCRTTPSGCYIPLLLASDVSMGGRTHKTGRTYIHYAIYEHAVGPIPGDHVLMKFCSTDHCTNPYHRYPVPKQMVRTLAACHSNRLQFVKELLATRDIAPSHRDTLADLFGLLPSQEVVRSDGGAYDEEPLLLECATKGVVPCRQVGGCLVAVREDGQKEHSFLVGREEDQEPAAQVLYRQVFDRTPGNNELLARQCATDDCVNPLHHAIIDAHDFAALAATAPKHLLSPDCFQLEETPRGTVRLVVDREKLIPPSEQPSLSLEIPAAAPPVVRQWGVPEAQPKEVALEPEREETPLESEEGGVVEEEVLADTLPKPLPQEERPIRATICVRPSASGFEASIPGVVSAYGDTRKEAIEALEKLVEEVKKLRL